MDVPASDLRLTLGQVEEALDNMKIKMKSFKKSTKEVLTAESNKLSVLENSIKDAKNVELKYDKDLKELDFVIQKLNKEKSRIQMEKLEVRNNITKIEIEREVTKRVVNRFASSANIQHKTLKNGLGVLETKVFNMRQKEPPKPVTSKKNNFQLAVQPADRKLKNFLNFSL